MKNTFLLAVIVFLFGCQSSDERIDESIGKDSVAKTDVSSKPEKVALQGNAESGVVTMLDEAGFIANIFDFKTKHEWKFSGDKPAIIDFYADWCGPCKKLSPTIEKLAKKYAGKIRVYKVNVDEQQNIAAVFGIQSIPTVLFCPMIGKPKASTGFVEEAELEKYIEQMLK